MRKAEVFMRHLMAGYLVEDEDGYHFKYDPSFLQNSNVEPVSLTLPLSEVEFHSKTMFPFFDGLIPEGWLLNIAERNWKIDRRDRMGLLLRTCRDCIGAVRIFSCESE